MKAFGLLTLAIAAVALLTGLMQVDDTLRNARIARERMATIWAGATIYAIEKDGCFPSAPHLLFPDYISDPEMFHHPGDSDPPPVTIDNSVPNAPNSAQISFDLLWGRRMPRGPDTIVIRDNATSNNSGVFINTMAVDGLIETVPPLATPEPPAEYIAQHNMRRIACAMLIYSNDNEEYFPQDLKQLWEGGYLDSPRTFWHPGDTDPAPTDITNNMPNTINSASISFDYVSPGRYPDADGMQVLLQDNDPANNGGGFISKVSLYTTEVEPPLAARTPTVFQTGQMNLRRVAAGLRAYAFDNDQWLPASIEDLWTTGYVDDPFYFWSPGDSDPRPTNITNAKPNAEDSAAISFVYEFEGDQPVRFEEATLELVQDNSPDNNRGLGISSVSSVRFVGPTNRWAAWQPDCPGDVDGDNRVGLTDLAILLRNYGIWYVANPWDGDINADNRVGSRDLQILLQHFGEVCIAPPGAPIDAPAAPR